jgi:tRNA (guanine-N7-)-methyltransferase
MGHGKLKKFEENKSFGCLLQPSLDEIMDKTVVGHCGLTLKDHPIKGHWNDSFFARRQPIVLELGCGKGEYATDLAIKVPECNYVGVDIKGARLWKGAKYVTENALPNVGFLRTRIEFAEAFFAPSEVSEIWLTFSDPQIGSENNRLTSRYFLERYSHFLKPGGIIHLKTDSMFLHEYTKAICKENDLKVIACTEDLYGGKMKQEGSLYEVRTYYEKMFLQQGFKITYMAFTIDHDGPYSAPVWDSDYWKGKELPRRTVPH